MALFNRDKGTVLVLFLFGLLFFAQHLNVHGLEYRDDEIFYFKSTQEMVSTGDTLSPKYFGEDRFQKPILFYWFILYAYKFFGMNWVAARLPSVVFAAWTLCLTWSLARRCFGRQVAFLSALILATMPMFFRHAKDAVPDMSLNFFVVFALWAAFRFVQEPKRKRFPFLFFLSCALGFMTKGYTALVVPLTTVIVYLIASGEPKKILQMRWWIGVIVLPLVITPWLVYMHMQHGTNYMNYVWVKETGARLTWVGTQSLAIRILQSFANNALYYLKVLLSYFSPWCLFLVGALPMAIKQIAVKNERGKFLLFFLIWFCVVFIFFSFVFVTLNHYLLVLSTPLAILISYFLCEGLSRREGTLKVALNYTFIFFLCIGFLGLLFFHLGLAGGGNYWLLVYLTLFVALILLILHGPSPVTAPFVFGLFMVAVFSQTPLMLKAGVSTHATLQKFAETIGNQVPAETIINVASYDIHEKELQAYFFEHRVEKTGEYDEALAHKNLVELIERKHPVYCLILDRDYQKWAPEFTSRHATVIQEEYIFRRRMKLDSGFIFAIINLDHGLIRTYLKEKILLLKLEAPHA